MINRRNVSGGNPYTYLIVTPEGTLSHINALNAEREIPPSNEIQVVQ